ncbi:MAG: hypothetical protein KDD46_05720, partial [Bdellovibrionales bacterium]|nr:hypothetical protein [Bdellovibrionales bacterium]
HQFDHLVENNAFGLRFPHVFVINANLDNERYKSTVLSYLDASRNNLDSTPLTAQDSLPQVSIAFFIKKVDPELP